MSQMKKKASILYAVKGLQHRGAVNDDSFMLYNMIIV